MKKLAELADYIHEYNLKGNNRLSPLKLAIIFNKNQQGIVDQIVNDLHCEKSHACFQLMGLSGYSIMRSANVQGLQLHLLSSLLDQENIADEMFVRRKKTLEKLRCSKQVMFLYLEAGAMEKELSNEKAEVLQLKRVDTSVCKSMIWRGSVAALCNEMVRTWESINRFEMIGVLANLKQLIKLLQANRKKQLQWLALKQRHLDQLSYALQLIHTTTDYLTCSLEGFYSNESSNFQNQFSVHWQIMDIFEDLWKEQGQRLNRELERMPLSYIGERLRMRNCQSLGGFLPESCFLEVFKPMLESLAENIMRCLQASKYKILQSVQSIYEFYFTKTSIKEHIVELELRNIDAICDQFLSQVQDTIYSQINYVYAPSESFWQMRNVQSNLYSEDQQANIEVKYIGKVYVKKVYESIRESIPRYIGQGLLRKVSKYFRDNGLNNLLELMKQTQFTIMLTPQQVAEIQQKQTKLLELGRLYQYFSLKINSTFKVKNLMEKNDMRWKQMYQKRQTEEKEATVEEKAEGFIGWIKKLLKSNRKDDGRSRSCEKEKIKQSCNQVPPQQPQPKGQEMAISEKLWILILNTNKKVDEDRLITACCEGFPEKLRPAIWYWLSTRHLQPKQAKITDILGKKEVDADTARQIQKDLGRTPPNQLFKVKLRGSLRKVLSAYSLIDHQIKYTQGMNFIAAVALATFFHWGTKDHYLMDNAEKPNFPDLQQKSFAILKFIMLRQGLRRIMFIERQYIAEVCFRIEERIKALSVKVWKMIEGSGFTCEIIFGPVLISGLSTWSKNIEVTRRILDLLICRGFSILYKVIAAIAVMSQQQLSRLSSEKLYDYLRNKSLDDFFQRAGHQGLTKLFFTL